MDILTSIISIGAIVGLVLTVLAKVLPNEKVYDMGIKVGQFLNSFGHAKIGEQWESVEDFFINSLGQFFKGIKIGLDLEIGNPVPELPKEEPEENKDNVRK